MKNLFPLLFSLLFIQNVTAQTIKDVEAIEREYQFCLDEGADMAGCSGRFYTEIDEILNIVYNNYSATLAQAEKDKLKTEQKEWLKERDAFFEKQHKIIAQNKDAGSDAIMFMLNDSALFVKKRVLFLIKKMEK